MHGMVLRGAIELMRPDSPLTCILSGVLFYLGMSSLIPKPDDASGEFLNEE